LAFISKVGFGWKSGKQKAEIGKADIGYSGIGSAVLWPFRNPHEESNAKSQRRQDAKKVPIRDRDCVFAALRLCVKSAASGSQQRENPAFRPAAARPISGFSFCLIPCLTIRDPV
jgi:hypothetical protein